MRSPLTMPCHDNDVTNKTRLSLTTALALTLTLGLGACSDDEPELEAPSVSAPDQTEDDQADDEQTDDAAADDTDDETTDDAAAGTDDDADDQAGATGDAGAGDLTAIALTAIGTAEAEAGGTAYEIDDQDEDGTWEVEVRVEDRSIEVTVSADGTQVVGTEEDDLDDEDRAALDAATITLSDAIELAVNEVGGVLDDAELEGEDDGEPHHWEVTVDTDDQDDIEVRISVDGEVIGTDS